MTKITIGCDPEVFLRNRSTGKFVSAFGKFPGTKQHPFKVNKGAVQVDGTALEFNIDPASTEDEFVENINTVMTQMYDMVKEVDPDLEIILAPIVEFDADVWNETPVEAKELGCDPDFNLHGIPNTSPADIIADTPVRTAAGHVHVGWNKEKVTPENQLKVVHRLQDDFMLEIGNWETEESLRRREYYGAVGAHRPKPYGVELRFTDNLWLKSEEHMRTVFRTASRAARIALL